MRDAHRTSIGLLLAASLHAIAASVQAQATTGSCGPLLAAIEKTLTAPRVKETLSLAAGDDKPTQLQFIRINDWEYFDARGRWEKERLKSTRDSQLGSVLIVAIVMAEDCKALGSRKVGGVEAKGYSFLPGVRISPHDGEVWVDAKSGLITDGKSKIKDGKTLVHYTYRYEYGPKVPLPKDAVDVTAERQRVREGRSPDPNPETTKSEAAKSDAKKASDTKKASGK